MKIREKIALTFDDVLLVPQFSEVESRSAVSTQTRLSEKIALEIPILSANMDTVTESSMAIEMALCGGMGMIHRFLSVEDHAYEVEKVKRASSFMIQKPVVVAPKERVEVALEIARNSGVSGLLVVDDEGKLVGILSHRDLRFVEEGDLVEELMTRENLVVAQEGVGEEEARKILRDHRIEKLPVVDEKGVLVGLMTAKDLEYRERYPKASLDEAGRLRVGVAIGVRESDMERAEACVASGADVLVIDIAHGHSSLAIKMVKRLRKAFGDIAIMAGNVATSEGVRALAEAGADSVKVGVGSGSICTTRIVTGSGVPQLSAIMECSKVARKLGVTLVSDGGIRTSGDITKALAGGADLVMLGSALAGTSESPGRPVVRDGRRFKVVRGMASLTANVDRRQVDSGKKRELEPWELIVPEGVEAMVPYRGPVKDILYLMVGGLRSGLTYSGARNIKELQKNAEFVRITGAGVVESRHHDVAKLP